jgi:hypothetical protein
MVSPGPFTVEPMYPVVSSEKPRPTGSKRHESHTPEADDRMHAKRHSRNRAPSSSGILFFVHNGVALAAIARPREAQARRRTGVMNWPGWGSATTQETRAVSTLVRRSWRHIFLAPAHASPCRSSSTPPSPPPLPQASPSWMYFGGGQKLLHAWWVQKGGIFCKRHRRNLGDSPAILLTVSLGARRHGLCSRFW